MHTEIILETSRVRLQPLTMEHMAALSAIAGEPEMWQFFSLNLANREMMKQWMETAIQEKATGKRIPFLIIDKISNSPAGSTSIGNISEYDLRAEIGWSWLGKQFRNTGVNFHAKFAMLRYLFDDLQFERVEFKTDVLNERAKNGLRKIGGKEEGVLRSHMKMWNNRRRDSIYYSIIKSEWPEVKEIIFKDLLHEHF